MNLYLAPLEGVTGYLFRNALYECFGGIDKYFIPFIKPNQHGHFSSRERDDILPEHNRGMYAVPQILTNSADDFVSTAEKLEAFGYREINLNLGCPSKTVVPKGRGSGFLAYPDELERFLEEIFDRTRIEISIKTRIGKNSSEEFERLLEIYNRFPMKELIIHPRTQLDFYKNHPNLEVYAEAAQNSTNPVCYNGDIFSKKGYLTFTEAFPQTDTVMIGRGLVMNPGLAVLIRSGENTKKETLKRFHDKLYESYREAIPGDRNVLFKMKELWAFLAPLFTDYQKYVKKIKKAERLKAYEDAVEALFSEQELKEEQ